VISGDVAITLAETAASFCVLVVVFAVFVCFSNSRAVGVTVSFVICLITEES